MNKHATHELAHWDIWIKNQATPFVLRSKEKAVAKLVRKNSATSDITNDRQLFIKIKYHKYNLSTQRTIAYYSYHS